MRRIEYVSPDGRHKVIERQLIVHCHQCNDTIACPDAADEWAWLKCGDVLDFYKAHDHGNPRLVGAELLTVEQ